MSLADRIDPIYCLKMVSDELIEHITLFRASLPREEDSQQDALMKLAIVERSLNEIKEWTKEGLKARAYAAKGHALALTVASQHITLEQFHAEEQPQQEELPAEEQQPEEVGQE